MAIADFTVLGGGIFGLSIAWVLTQRGAQVRLIEAARIGAGSSGGIVGALAPHAPENWNDKKAFQLDSLLSAEAFWQGVADASGRDPGYARLGRVQMIADARGVELAHARAKGADALWQGKAHWHVVRDDSFPSWAGTSATGWLIHDTLTARLHPRQAGAALTVALQNAGAEVLMGDHGVQGVVIEATGVAGLSELTTAFGKQVGNGVKGQGALFGFDARNQPQLFLDGLHIVPHADGTTAIGSTSEREFGDGTATDHQLEALIDKARRLCPALQDAPVIERWAGVRPRSKSRAPMLGIHPLRPERFIANGGFKIGFGMAPKIAHVMADLVMDGRDTIPDGFRPEASL